MEIILAILAFLTVFGGLALGLMLSGKPPQTACDGVRCAGGRGCDGCPRRSAEEQHHE